MRAPHANVLRIRSVVAGKTPVWQWARTGPREISSENRPTQSAGPHTVDQKAGSRKPRAEKFTPSGIGHQSDERSRHIMKGDHCSEDPRTYE